MWPFSTENDPRTVKLSDGQETYAWNSKNAYEKWRTANTIKLVGVTTIVSIGFTLIMLSRKK